MYQARLHPEQYSNTFSDEQIATLHKAIMYVCDTAVGVLADPDQFPKDWLMNHRWGKGKKDGGKLPNGARIIFLKVGGRTSAVVPSVQKKTAAVAGDVSEIEEENDDDEDEEEEVGAKPKKAAKQKGKISKKEDGGTKNTPGATKRGRKKVDEDVIKAESDEEEIEEDSARALKKQKTDSNATTKNRKNSRSDVKKEDESGRRRSGRLSR